MPRSKVDDVLIIALGRERSIIAAKINDLQMIELQTLQAELVAVETKLKEIDPTIPTLAEEADAALEAAQALEAKTLADDKAAAAALETPGE